ncbi:MAG TPA: trigger factor, partial [Anaerolineae bacterium]|nr:trigger factor [Anaerolineae bacterium]
MTKVEVKELTGCTKKILIEIERERFDSEFSGTLKSMRKDIQIHGFRKGKAPESMIVRRFGPVVREEAVKTMIPKVLDEVYKSEGLNPVGEPEISDLKIDETGPISFSVTIEEVPDIDIEAYKNLAVTKEIAGVTDEDIENTLERYRHMKAVRHEVDREVQEGDILTVNLQKTDMSGVPLIGEKTENQTIYLDEKSVPSKEFLDQVVGMKKGD